MVRAWPSVMLFGLWPQCLCTGLIDGRSSNAERFNMHRIHLGIYVPAYNYLHYIRRRGDEPARASISQGGGPHCGSLARLLM